MARPFFFVLFAFVFLLSLANSESDMILQITGKETAVDMCDQVTAPASCPVTCFRADPVCGENGVTYWCGCGDAKCNGARVSKLGPCEVGNGGSASLPRQALLLVHIVWLILLGFSLLFGLF